MDDETDWFIVSSIDYSKLIARKHTRATPSNRMRQTSQWGKKAMKENQSDGEDGTTHKYQNLNKNNGMG